MSRSVPRLVGVAALALLLGGMRGVETNLDVVLNTFASRGTLLYPALDLILMGSFLVVGLVGGYAWGLDADVRSAYLSFVGVVTVALSVGFLAGYVFVALLSVVGPGELYPYSLATAVLWDVALFVTSLHLPLVGLAGAAIGNYHSTTGGESGRRSGESVPG